MTARMIFELVMSQREKRTEKTRTLQKSEAVKGMRVGRKKESPERVYIVVVWRLLDPEQSASNRVSWQIFENSFQSRILPVLPIVFRNPACIVYNMYSALLTYILYYIDNVQMVSSGDHWRHRNHCIIAKPILGSSIFRLIYVHWLFFKKQTGSI